MTSEAHITTIDPEVAGQAGLPPAPDAALLLVHVPRESGDVCAWHLLDFARRWRDEGRQVHLLDACVDTPVLHHAADVENAEGVSDAILYGSSLARISVPIEQDVMLTTAGTVVGDSTRVLDHPRWSSITAAVTDAGGMLIVTVPADAEASRLEELADAVLRFVPGGSEDTGDDESVPVADASRAAAGATTGPADRERPGADRSTPDSTSAADVAAGASPAETASSRSVGTTTRQRSGNRGLVIFILLLLALLGVLGAGYLGFIELPGITPTDVDSTIDLFPLR